MNFQLSIKEFLTTQDGLRNEFCRSFFDSKTISSSLVELVLRKNNKKSIFIQGYGILNSKNFKLITSSNMICQKII